MIQCAHGAGGMGTLYQAQAAPEILPAIAAIQEHLSQSRRHKDQEYDTYTTCKVEICGI
ncbi:MAG: hypothetical protein IPL63_12135 [Saprospiraceae bacterium]|nr:hypothetical protein [Saprospiraceae bacterium]MBK8372355.1 hypothetical protein [Saprospiraceae bacterium]MBK8548083.1 hypothetical protein [Saprospiraceae bacterium]MBK8854932.1 hypothetical protein [Saprospiraceae bacterium]MBK9043059.1 hypothetical protein [Saprospiraceae bacterium]